MRKLSGIFMLAAVLARQALACPGCKDAIAQNGVSNPWGSAFNISIIFMLGTVLGLVCALGFAVYRMVRAEERRNGIHADPRALRMHKIGAGVVMALVAVLVFWPKSASATKPQPVSDLPTLSDTALQSELARGKGVLVVEVGATWCPPCRMFAPAVSQVSKELSGTVPFYFMELDASPATAKQFQVSDLPCLILFKDGKEAARYVGLTTPTALKEFVKKNSGNP